jgi:hypothetical protein
MMERSEFKGSQRWLMPPRTPLRSRALNPGVLPDHEKQAEMFVAHTKQETVFRPILALTSYA